MTATESTTAAIPAPECSRVSRLNWAVPAKTAGAEATPSRAPIEVCATVTPTTSPSGARAISAGITSRPDAAALPSTTSEPAQDGPVG